MKLHFEKIVKWPKLAWVAKAEQGSQDIIVMHGPCVETGRNWCVEAVWAGDFSKGDFDRTDLVFGSGVRCRDDKVIFVSSGTTLDRLYYSRADGSWFVSNSLPALLACSKISLETGYFQYADDIRSIEEGLEKYCRRLPARPENIHLMVFHNLGYDGRRFREEVKPDPAPSFQAYDDYHNFLIGTATRLQRNFGHPGRRHKVLPLASISSGYDSPAAAAISKHAGCREAVTIKNASSMTKRTDSGYRVARALGMACRQYNRVKRQYDNEIAIWAAAGVDLDLNLTVFDYPEPLCLFFTGFNGDRIWDRRPHVATEAIEWGGSISGHGFSEYRIHKGVFNCVVPFWGVRHAQEIFDITLSAEMKEWSLMSDYDRPIARRIVENSNVPRGIFAYRKAISAMVANRFFWPHSTKENKSYRDYLAKLRISAPLPGLVALYRFLAMLGIKIRETPFLNGLDPHIWFNRFDSRTNHLLFQWANTELRKLYEEGIG